MRIRFVDSWGFFEWIESFHPQALAKLGEEFVFNDEDLPPLEDMVCSLYGLKDVKSINIARYRQFCTGASGEQSLPPTQDALLLHIKRANYQSAIWSRSLVAVQDAPMPQGHGWVLTDEGDLAVQWMTKEPAPKQYLKLSYCSCVASGCAATSACGCIKSNLSCTDLCKCKACGNRSEAAE